MSPLASIRSRSSCPNFLASRQSSAISRNCFTKDSHCCCRKRARSKRSRQKDCSSIWPLRYSFNVESFQEFRRSTTVHFTRPFGTYGAGVGFGFVSFITSYLSHGHLPALIGSLHHDQGGDFKLRLIRRAKVCGHLNPIRDSHLPIWKTHRAPIFRLEYFD